MCVYLLCFLFIFISVQYFNTVGWVLWPVKLTHITYTVLASVSTSSTEGALSSCRDYTDSSGDRLELSAYSASMSETVCLCLWNDVWCVNWDVRPYSAPASTSETVCLCLWNDLWCVNWDVKPYSVQASTSETVCLCLWNDLWCVNWDVKHYSAPASTSETVCLCRVKWPLSNGSG